MKSSRRVHPGSKLMGEQLTGRRAMNASRSFAACAPHRYCELSSPRHINTNVRRLIMAFCTGGHRKSRGLDFGQFSSGFSDGKSRGDFCVSESSPLPLVVPLRHVGTRQQCLFVAVERKSSVYNETGCLAGGSMEREKNWAARSVAGRGGHPPIVGLAVFPTDP